jgi:hypothetical protein
MGPLEAKLKGIRKPNGERHDANAAEPIRGKGRIPELKGIVSLLYCDRGEAYCSTGRQRVDSKIPPVARVLRFSGQSTASPSQSLCKAFQATGINLLPHLAYCMNNT